MHIGVLLSRNTSVCVYNAHSNSGRQNAAPALAEPSERSITMHPAGFTVFAAKHTARFLRPSNLCHVAPACAIDNRTE